MCSEDNTDKLTCKSDKTIIIGGQGVGGLVPHGLSNIPTIRYKTFGWLQYMQSYGDNISGYEFILDRETDRLAYTQILKEIIKDGRMFDKASMNGCEIEFTNYTAANDLFLTVRITFKFTDTGLLRPL